jgi:hypothetical protein
VSVDTAAPCTTDPATIAAHYETLRSAALGAPLLPEARHGLLLFLRRGMWAWTQTVATAAVAPPRTRVPAPGSASSPELRGVIHVFAAMALSALHGSAR